MDPFVPLAEINKDQLRNVIPLVRMSTISILCLLPKNIENKTKVIPLSTYRPGAFILFEKHTCLNVVYFIIKGVNTRKQIMYTMRVNALHLYKIH